VVGNNHFPSALWCCVSSCHKNDVAKIWATFLTISLEEAEGNQEVANWLIQIDLISSHWNIDSGGQLFYVFVALCFFRGLWISTLCHRILKCQEFGLICNGLIMLKECLSYGLWITYIFTGCASIICCRKSFDYRHCLHSDVHIKVKVKSTVPHEECWWGAHLPYLGLEPVGR